MQAVPRGLAAQSGALLQPHDPPLHMVPSGLGAGSLQSLSTAQPQSPLTQMCPVESAMHVLQVEPHCVGVAQATQVWGVAAVSQRRPLAGVLQSASATH